MKSIDRYQAEFMARVHYGLPPLPGAKGRTHGISKRRNNLERAGLLDGEQLTEKGLALLAKYCIGRAKGPGEHGRRDARAGRTFYLGGIRSRTCSCGVTSECTRVWKTKDGRLRCPHCI